MSPAVDAELPRKRQFCDWHLPSKSERRIVLLTLLFGGEELKREGITLYKATKCVLWWRKEYTPSVFCLFLFHSLFSKITVVTTVFLITCSSCGLLIQVFNIYCGVEFTEKGRLEQERGTPELWRRGSSIWCWLLRLHISGNVAGAKSE